MRLSSQIYMSVKRIDCKIVTHVTIPGHQLGNTVVSLKNMVWELAAILIISICYHVCRCRIKNKIFFVCFAHLRWCHNGWASNILSGGYWRRLNYWTPIHYDTFENVEKKLHLLFSFLFRICYFCILSAWSICHKYYYIILFNNYTPLENKSIQILSKITTWRSSRCVLCVSVA